MRHGAQMQALALAAAWASAACSSMCGDEGVADVVSPDSQFVARSFVRNCGATTDFAAHVELRRNRWWFRGQHTVFIAKGAVNVSVAWRTPREIVIACNGCPSLGSSVAESPAVRVTLEHRSAETGDTRAGVRAGEQGAAPDGRRDGERSGRAARR